MDKNDVKLLFFLVIVMIKKRKVMKTWSRDTNSSFSVCRKRRLLISLLTCVVAVFVVFKILNPLLIAATV